MKNLLFVFIFCIFHVGVFAQITLSATTQAATCSANGAIDVTVSGGVAPYIIMLNGNPQPQNTPNAAHIQGLSPAVYQLWVKDANGQISATQNITVTGSYIEPSLTCLDTLSKKTHLIRDFI